MAVTYFDKEKYQRKPEWLKVRLPEGEDFKDIRNNMREKGLSTVCEEAKCPNISECWSARTATVMILGDTCTRACKFCHVKTGNPKGFLNPEEIDNTSKMVGLMSLRYIVITSVDRDDLPDYGAGHFAAVIKRVNQDHPDTKVEVLIPDFAGISEHMHTLAEAKPFVIAQNIETVKRLTHPVRDPRAGYERTLSCLKFYKENYPQIQTKTSIMVGLGETWKEIQETLEDLREVGVDIVTFGQYLQPSKRHLNVERFYTPDEFEELKRMSLKMGFKFVASWPPSAKLIQSRRFSRLHGNLNGSMNILSGTDLTTFGILENDFFELDERTTIVKKWNWDYALAHAFQRHALTLLDFHPRERILICCNHPRVLTNGRGLQKPRKGESFDLVEFDPESVGRLPYPLHQIERGGGLTFHHPGQFIFYPILKLNPSSLSLSRMTDEIFDFAIEILSDWEAQGLNRSKKLLGLWQENRKLASMGIAIEKLTTFHGMALNLFIDQEMKRALETINPCGLSANVYIAAEEICTLPPEALEKFTDEFLKRIKHAW